MKRLGRVIHITPSKKAVLKAEHLPKIGDRVVDESSFSVGEVFDVFGSVSSPYVEVKTEVEDPYKLVGCFLYVYLSSNRREKRRRG